MKPPEIITLFNYNTWANSRILASAAQISDASYIAPSRLSHGSLRGTLVHILSAEWAWRMRCQEGISPAGLLSEEEFPTVEAVRQRWHLEIAAWDTYLFNLQQDDLTKIVRYTNTKGQTFENLVWQILVHVVNHGTQFRSEAALYLTQLDCSPGDLDFIYYVRQIQVI